MTGFFVNDFVHYFQKTVSISWNRVCRYFFCQTTIKIQFGIHRTLSGFFTLLFGPIFLSLAFSLASQYIKVYVILN